VLPAIQKLATHFPHAFISIDTFRSGVAKAAVEAGARLINDISGGTLDENMFATVARLKVPYILMHMRGTPQTMAALNRYLQLTKEVSDFFRQQVHRLHQLGVYDIVLDPGFGFAKNPSQNFELLQHLEDFKIHDRPLLVGLSRKSMIWKTLNSTAEQSLNGTTVLNTIALIKGASILRVHDVKEAKEAVLLMETTAASKTNYTNA
jgi:dihydropteroate synthase